MRDFESLDLFAAPAVASEIRAAPVPGPRQRDVTPAGPNRFYIRGVNGTSEKRELVDRDLGIVLDEGPWLFMWGRALQLNGLLEPYTPNPSSNAKG